MEKIKKVALSILVLFAFVFCIHLNIYAGATTANAKGISTTGLTYVGDYSTSYNEIRGSKYYYGKIKLWSSVYEFYHEDNDTMYYVVFVQSFINGDGKQKKIGYFHSYGMDVSINANGMGIEQVAYRPAQGTSETNISYQTTLSSQVGTDSNITIGFSYGKTVNLSDVNLLIDSDDSTNHSYLDFDYKFRYYDDRTDSERSPYVGEYYEISSVVYEIENYSIKSNNAFVFDISYTGFIHRDNLKNSTDYLMARNIKHIYTVQQNSVYSYDVIGEAYDVW